VQQIIAVIVGGYDIETGLRLLVQLYESRGIRNRLVDALTEIAAVTQSTGALLPALRSRAGLLGEENLRRVLASLARGHEHGTSIVKELQDIVRSLAPPGRALGGIAYLSQPLPRFTALAGLPFDALSFRVIQCGLFAAGIATGFAAHMSSTSIMLLAAFCAALPYLFGLSKIRSRRLEFESEFPFFVGQLTALLRGGDDTITALQKVNQYCSESSAIRIQVELLLESLAAGEDEGEATVAFALDVPSPGAEQLAISFALSRMVPGKLCHMLEQAVMAVRATS